MAKFITIIGGDKPIGDITKTDCRHYKETLLKSVGATTTNTRLNSISHLWAWAQGQGFVPDEQRCPVTGLTINARVEKKGKLERKPFTDADLSLILTHPKFLKEKNARVERYWLILALVLTGARREEIAQLALNDLKEEGGILYFNITNEGESQSLKNEASKRRVPSTPTCSRWGS